MPEKSVFFKSILPAAFAAGLVLGICACALFFTVGQRSERGRLTKRLEQVNIDLERTRSAQRDASERARRLQEELAGITEYARSLESGSRRSALRAGELTERLGSIIEFSGELEHGIERAQSSLNDSRVLVDELGTILRGIQVVGGTENTKP